MGLVALAAFVIALLVQTGVPRQISSEVERLVCEIAQVGGCPESPSLAGPGTDVPEGADVEVYDAGNGSDFPGDIVREDGQDPVGDAEVDAVHDNFQRLHEYFMSRFPPESGALNEAISDIFASNLDPDDWELGEDLPGGAIRGMANPERFGQPSHTDDYENLPVGLDGTWEPS